MINRPLLSIVVVLIACCAAIGLLRLEIDTDIVRSLPSDDTVIADALDIFTHHPFHDQVAVDIMLNEHNPELLVKCSELLQEKMVASGLFSQVGVEPIGEMIRELAVYSARSLPLLFSREELEQDIAPRLESAQIDKRLQGLLTALSSMEGIGQEVFIQSDPLGFKDLILAKMALLAPTTNSKFFKGHLLSADGRHLLLIAQPLKAGTDTASAHDVTNLIKEGTRELNEKFGSRDRQVTLNPVGAYRAALDNERIIRHDVQLALVFATAGIALLLLFSFPRPLIGLLSLVPAIAGSAAALCVYSLFNSSLSILVLGFGGAIISITVDHGIAYLLFFDRPSESKGKHASREVRAIGMMAVITSIGAFLILGMSGFPIFTQLGRFTALGIFFSFLFVHSIFPRLFPAMPAGSNRRLPIRTLVNALYSTGKAGATAAALLAIGLLFFAKPQFHVSLSSMNTVSEATLAAEDLFTKVWGNIGNRVFLMHSADSIAGIQQGNDQQLAMIEEDIQNDILANAFVPSMLFPGQARSRHNLEAWHLFWNQERVERVKETMLSAGTDLGFTTDAFTGFFSLLEPTFTAPSPVVPSKYYNLLGIAKDPQQNRLVQFITTYPGTQYDAAAFQERYAQSGKIFDAVFFTDRLADILFSSFTGMLLIIGISLTLLLAVFYLDLHLTLLTLLPVIFAYICTLGTLKLLDRPLDIPALMLSIIILGMGIDYSIFCVRAHQRYRNVAHPSYALIRCGVFLAASSTLMGFGVLCFASHSLLQSIGITSFFGVAYSLLGTFLLLPPLLNHYFAGSDRTTTNKTTSSLDQRIRNRYRFMEAYPRMFARFKLQYDPLFKDLKQMLAQKKNIKTIIDIGCGYGVPACWCLEYFEEARIRAIDPDLERVRVASLAVGNRGTVTHGSAPSIPPGTDPVDLVLLLDMLHYLDDKTLRAVFSNSLRTIKQGGIIVIRFVTNPPGQPSWSWRLEDTRVRLTGKQCWYRSAEEVTLLLVETGFLVTVNEPSVNNNELVWLVGSVEKETPDAKNRS